MNNKILIADDAAFMRMMLKTALNEANYNDIIEAKTGSDAVIMYKVERPAVVLMDVTMPDKDGLEALKDIKLFDQHEKVFMCSSMGQEDVVVTCFSMGADDFVMKPFKPERIVQAVSKFVQTEE